MDQLGRLREQTVVADPDLLRQRVKIFAEALMSAEAEISPVPSMDKRSPGRTNRRNGYRAREWDTRAGSVELAAPELRTRVLPEWLPERRRWAEQALNLGGRHQLPAGRVHPAGEKLLNNTRYRQRSQRGQDATFET